MNLNWRTFRVGSFKEFVERYTGQLAEIIPAGDSFKVFSRNQPQLTFSIDAPVFKSSGSFLHADSPMFTPQKAHKPRNDSMQVRSVTDLLAGHARVQSAFLMPDGIDAPAFCLENLGMAPPPGFE